MLFLRPFALAGVLLSACSAGGDGASSDAWRAGPDGAPDDARTPDAGDAARPEGPPDGLPDARIGADAVVSRDANTDAARGDASTRIDVGTDGATFDGALPPADARAPLDGPPPPPPPPPLLTEVVAQNDHGLKDADGDRPDWIELYNPAPVPQSLAGWHLTDRADDPTAWTFPDITLGAHRYLIVFASKKDRRDPAGELHANFKLDADGEYLALTDPAGQVVQAFDPIPPLRPDTAYGLPAIATRTVLVDAATPARVAFTDRADVPADFAAADFDDAAFADATAAIGYDRSTVPASPLILTDSVGAFSGRQGANDWTYGYHDFNVAPDPALNFVPFPDNFWNGSGWDWVGGDPPFAEIFNLGGHPNGRLHAGGVLWASRRWTAGGPGRVRLRGVMGTYSLYGDGTLCHVLVDGVDVLTEHVHNERKRYDLTLDVDTGTVVDLAIDPGWDGLDDSDRTLFTARIELADPQADDRGKKLADSVTDWSPTGGQGAAGWTMGYWDVASDADGAYGTADFTPFPRDEGAYGPTDFWTGAAWDWPGGDPPWTMMDADYTQPNGPGAPGAQIGEQWPIRRWQSPVDGDLLVRWGLSKAQAGGGGVTGHVFHQGAEVDAVTLGGNDLVGTERFVALPGVHAGDMLDFAVDPLGADGRHDEGADLSRLSAEVWGLGVLTPYVGTDVSVAMGARTDALLRVPFTLPDGPPPERLSLSVRADDGFSVSLDGQEVARHNLPAVSDRSTAKDAEPVEIDLTDQLSQLHNGPNLLAIQAEQGPLDDGRFLLSPRLEARTVAMDVATPGHLLYPTPGADNLTPDFELPPQVEVQTRYPVVRGGDPMTVIARVEPGTAALDHVNLVSRVMFGPEETTEMFDLGDGTWQAFAFLTARPGELVRFRVEAVDVDGRPTRDPVFTDSADGEAWYGTVIDDVTIDTALPILHWFAGRPDEAASDQGTRGDLFYGGELYDNVRFTLHGQSSRGFPKHSYNVDFTSDHRFRIRPEFGRVKDANLLSNYADKSKLRNTLAWETFRDAGGDHHIAFPVHVRQNGQFYAVYDLLDDADDRYLARLGRNPEGALYKIYDAFEDIANAEKKTRKNEDKADLQAILDVMGQDPDTVRRYLFDQVNLAAMANFLAGLVIVSTTDCCHKNYYAFHDIGVTDQWWFMPWDLDLTFGRNWTGGYFDDTMYPQNGLYVGNNNRLLSPLLSQPEFQIMYLRRVRTLLDQLVQPPETPVADRHYESRIDALVTEIGADGDADLQAWPPWGVPQDFAEAVRALREDFLAQRRAYMYATAISEVGGPLPPAVPRDQMQVSIDAADPAPQNPLEAYVRLTNAGPLSVDVSGWRLSGAGIDRTLEAGTVILAGGALFVCANIPAFLNRAAEPHGGMALTIQGNFTGTLDPGGALPMLFDAAGEPASPP